ncbi:hypothetical protein ACFDTO_13395 [Microbacteriaceae bacterium 4G12]
MTIDKNRKFSDLNTEELENMLICSKNKSFAKFAATSMNYEKGINSKNELDKEIEALKLLEKDVLINTVHRVNSIEEQYDGYKMIPMVVAIMTTLLAVIGNNYFFNSTVVKKNGLMATALTFIILLVVDSVVCIILVTFVKKQHSRLLFFKNIVEECIKRKEKIELEEKEEQREKIRRETNRKIARKKRF